MTNSMDTPVQAELLSRYDIASQSVGANQTTKVDSRSFNAKFAARAIASGSFVTWACLMLVVAILDGNVLQLVAITLIPFVAHVVTMLLPAGDAARADLDK